MRTVVWKFRRRFAIVCRRERMEQRPHRDLGKTTRPTQTGPSGWASTTTVGPPSYNQDLTLLRLRLSFPDSQGYLFPYSTVFPCCSPAQSSYSGYRRPDARPDGQKRKSGNVVTLLESRGKITTPYC